MGNKGNATSSKGNNVACQARVVKCYNCQGKGHMARQCTKPKRPRNSAWFKEKMLLVQAQESGQELDKEQLAFLANPRVVDGQVTQITIPQNAAFQTDDLDAYDSDCDDISSAKAILMANLSSHYSDVLSEMSKQMSNHVTNWDKVNQETKTVNESLTAKLERYKERVKNFEQRYNVDLTSREKLIDSQIDDMIQNRNALKQEFDSLKQTLSKETEHLNVTQTPLEVEVPNELPKGFEHTKKVFIEEFIPFINSLRATFKDFDNGLHSELTEVKTVFNQMEAAVEQCFVDKKYFDIQKKELSLDNDRLLDHIICQDIMNIVMLDASVPVNVLFAHNKCLVNDNLEIERLEQENDHLFKLLLSQDIVHICVNSLASRNDCREMQQSFIHEYNENLVLKVELAKKEHMVEKKFFDEVVLKCSRLKNRSANLELKLQHQKETKLDAKDVSIAKLKQHIKNLKGKKVVEKDAPLNNAKVIAPGIFKLDLEPLAPKVLKNRDAHIDYIKHSWEDADTRREIFKHARALRPLDYDLDFACKYAKRIQEVLVYVTDTCLSLTKPSEKLVAVTPLNKNNKVRFAKTATSSSNTQKQIDSHKTQDSNKHVLPSTRMKSYTSASRLQPSSNTKKNRISQTTTSNQKNKVEDHHRSIKSKSNKMNRVIEPVYNENVKNSMLNANSELICATCNECMFDAIHDLCVLDFVNGVNVRCKSKSAKSIKKKNVWKPTGKMFTDIGYRWKPTERTFTIDGNTCPLTRITCTKVVNLKETTSK
ncbi:integrase, catalytic region, zinc finger, CCHC-type containing protein [Tanacetum coccineum]